VLASDNRKNASPKAKIIATGCANLSKLPPSKNLQIINKNESNIARTVSWRYGKCQKQRDSRLYKS
jgi:hypothetical protein